MADALERGRVPVLVDEFEQRVAATTRPPSRTQPARSRRARSACGTAARRRDRARCRPCSRAAGRRPSRSGCGRRGRGRGIGPGRSRPAACPRHRRRRPPGARPRSRAQRARDVGGSPRWRRGRGRTRSATNSFENAGCGHVGGLRRQHDLGVGRDVDLAHAAAGVDDRDAAHLGVVFGRDQHLHRRGQRAVAPRELGAILAERDLVVVGLHAGGLEARRPDVAAAHVPEEHVRTPVVAGRVLAPPGHGQVPPAAVAGAGGGEHHRVAPVRQQLRGRRRVVRGAEPTVAARSALADPGARLRLRRPGTRRSRRPAGCAPAAGAPSPGRWARRGSACAWRRRAARPRWRRSSCPGGGP